MTNHDLKFLIALCYAEVNRCGLDTEQGRKAMRMAEKLKALITK